MNNKIVPLSQPKVELGMFLKACHQAFGYNANQPADDSHRKVSDDERFLVALACFHDDNNVKRPILEIIRNSASVCAHLHYSFLFVTDDETVFKSMERSGLKHTAVNGLRGKTMAVVSGNLADWYRGIIECCNSEADPTLRDLYNQAALWFEKQGLRLWFDFTKKATSDGTFSLIRT